MAWRCRFITARRSQLGCVIVVHATHWLISTQVATFAEQAKWHGRSELLGSVLDWGFPLMALPSLYGAARFEAVWKPTSELGYTFVDPCYRADAATGRPKFDFHTGSRSTRTPSASRRARLEATVC